MKAGEIVTFAHREGDRVEGVNAHATGAARCEAFSHYGTHSDEHYGISDASKPVENGRAEYVVVCKVIAVVRRSVKVEQ